MTAFFLISCTTMVVFDQASVIEPRLNAFGSPRNARRTACEYLKAVPMSSKGAVPVVPALPSAVFPSDSLLTPEQVCERLAVCRKTLQRICNAKQIAFVRVGGSIRFRPSAVEYYIASRTTKAAA